MDDKDIIELYEKIWNADIINKPQPLYDIATSVADQWSPHMHDGACSRPPLTHLLVKKLQNKWEEMLIMHINGQIGPGFITSTPVPTNTLSINRDISRVFKDLREKHKDSRVITQIIDKIARDFTMQII